MKKQFQLTVAGVTIAVMSLSLMASSASGQQASFPRVARGLTTWMARAMDQCNPATLSVVTPNLPSGGCLQTNSVTDGTLGMKFAKLRLNQRGRIGLFGTGFTLGDALRVRLTLRVTRGGMNVKHLPGPGTNKRVTFVDTTIDCPKAPDAFSARPNGAVAGSTDLAACLTPTTGLASGNIEILDASLVNVATGKIVAVPGILR